MDEKKRKLTPLDPPLSGGKQTPSPDKGRAGEGLSFIPYNKSLTTLARANRKSPTAAERKLWSEVLRMRHFAQHKFLRQKPIANYIIDFYCSELCLIIEIDGDSHAESVGYDAQRTTILNGYGLTVIRYTNSEVLTNIHGVFDDLSSQITKLTSP